MNTTRLLDRAMLISTAVGVLLLTAIPAAYAGPVPIEPEHSGAGAGGGGGVGSSAGTTLREVLTIGAAGAVLAILVALAVYLAAHHRTASHRPARTA